MSGKIKLSDDSNMTFGWVNVLYFSPGPNSHH